LDICIYYIKMHRTMNLKFTVSFLSISAVFNQWRIKYNDYISFTKWQKFQILNLCFKYYMSYLCYKYWWTGLFDDINAQDLYEGCPVWFLARILTMVLRALWFFSILQKTALGHNHLVSNTLQLIIPLQSTGWDDYGIIHKQSTLPKNRSRGLLLQQFNCTVTQS
jgi:hypothetical protein